MTKKFGAQILGVHGQELPKFADKMEDSRYWKYQKGFRADPTC
jgi:hypothetical protein